MFVVGFDKILTMINIMKCGFKFRFKDNKPTSGRQANATLICLLQLLVYYV